MFNFFKRKGGKAEAATGMADTARKYPNENVTKSSSVDSRSPRNENDVTNEKSNTLRKDVINLLIPETNYSQKTGVGALLDMMAGKRKKNKMKTIRTESCRLSPEKETQSFNLQRSKSDLEPRDKQATCDDVVAPTAAKNTQDASHAAADPADFVKALVLQKYANKTLPDTKQHVSIDCVLSEPNLDEKRHTEALLREIAKSIDCTIDNLNVNKGQMGTTDSKNVDKEYSSQRREPIYEAIQENDNNNSIKHYKQEVKEELSKLLNNESKEKEIEIKIEKEFDNEKEKKINVENVIELEIEEEKVDSIIDGSTESLAFRKKSNLKPPRSDTEGGSDDDRSECGKKRVTFQKHIIFDDGEQQTDEEVDSSFETLTSEEEEEEEEEEESLQDALPDNDELLGGVVVSRNENDKPVNNIDETECLVQNEPIRLEKDCVEDGLQRVSSDNSDSGFVEISDKSNECSYEETSEIKTLCVENSSESEVSESESIEEEEVEEEEEEVEVVIEEEIIGRVFDGTERTDKKNLVSQESKFQSQVAALTELAETRCGEAEKARELIATYRKEIEEKDHEIQRLKCDLEAAYKESELVKQKSHSLEEELSAARGCSADLADKLHRRNDESVSQLRGELEDALTRRAELESKVLALERDKERLEQEKHIQEQKAQEAITAAEANTTKWRKAHEAARSQAAARAELMLADCEWKMRELEKRARDAEKQNKELTQTVQELKAAAPSESHKAELQQLRGLATEQQRSVQALTLKLQRVETREEALKLEVHRLKDLLEKEARIAKEKEERHTQAVERLQQQHSAAVETLKSEHASVAAATRAALERTHAERTRNALAQLRADSEKEARNADRKLREVTTRFENLKEVLASKESQFEQAIAEAHSKADWDIMQLRHLLDKADITYANNIENMNERFEKEKESLIKEWSDKLKDLETKATNSQEESKRLLESTRIKLTAEKNDQLNKLKDQHRREMDEQWEQFMQDKENCLSRMKAECRQEGDEERIKRERELLEEIAELKGEIQSKCVDFNKLEVKTAACGRTLAVTEQELREALAREKELREKRGEDSTKIKQLERASKDQIEHLTRKCACLRKLFDDMRNRLSARERTAEQEARAKEKELHQLRAEVARLTKILVEQSAPSLGTRTRADGCETLQIADESMVNNTQVCDAQPNAPRRKGGTLKTPEAIRKRLNLPDLMPLPPEARKTTFEDQNGRRRAKSVDLPAVQVPVRIKQLEEKTKE